MPTPNSNPSATALKVAIVGSGPMARRHAAAVARAASSARVVAFADPDERARAAFLEECPGATPYPSLTALLAANSIDVVHVCTPPSTHEDLAIEALEAGCHVYVEKPFAETADGAKRVLELAARRACSVCAGHQLLFEAPARRAAELLPALGAVVHLESYFAFRPVRTGAGGRKPLRDDLQLLDVLPHPERRVAQKLRAQPHQQRRHRRVVGIGERRPLAALPVERLVAEELEPRRDQALRHREGDRRREDGALHARDVTSCRRVHPLHGRPRFSGTPVERLHGRPGTSRTLVQPLHGRYGISRMLLQPLHERSGISKTLVWPLHGRSGISRTSVRSLH